MNPNSAHQVWSFWEYRVYPSARPHPDFATVQANCARFGREVFGSASQMRVTERTDHFGRRYFEIAVRSEGHPVHDPRYTAWMHDTWRRFFLSGFGPRAEVHAHAHLEAGDRQDGTPPDQLILMPTLVLKESVHG